MKFARAIFAAILLTVTSQAHAFRQIGDTQQCTVNGVPGIRQCDPEPINSARARPAARLSRRSPSTAIPSIRPLTASGRRRADLRLLIWFTTTTTLKTAAMPRSLTWRSHKRRESA